MSIFKLIVEACELFVVLLFCLLFGGVAAGAFASMGAWPLACVIVGIMVTIGCFSWAVRDL